MEHTRPTANLLLGKDSAMPSTTPAHGGIHDIVSTSDPAWSGSPYFGGDYDPLTADFEGWMADELDCNMGYIIASRQKRIIESLLSFNCYTDTDLEAWYLNFSSLLPL